MNQFVTLTGLPAPVLVKAVGDCATYRFFEFFTAQIMKPNTRRT